MCRAASTLRRRPNLLLVEVARTQHVVLVLLEQAEPGARGRLRPLAEVPRLEHMPQPRRHAAVPPRGALLRTDGPSSCAPQR
eukprot:scaffold10182_cov107-Isochrysis_galbana.AAC.3